MLLWDSLLWVTGEKVSKPQELYNDFEKFWITRL